MKTAAPSLPFGLIAILAQTRIHLPLVHIETRFRVMGEVAQVEMDQVFEQTAREALDVTYTFPLPEGAAVHRCEMIVNGRVIRAVVMESAEARAKVAAEKAAGRRTALVEMERGNLFTFALGNVAPGDKVVIRFAYVESLERLGRQLSLRIPFCPGVRYIPGKPLLRSNRGQGTEDDTDEVPDASRITPLRIHGSHEDAATLYLQGVLEDGEVDLRTLDCPTHPAIMRSRAGHIEVELAGEEHVPDRDLVLRWHETSTTEPKAHAWAVERAGHRYALLQVRAPQQVEVSTVDAAGYAQDVYFLLDQSGSMEGLNWQKSIQALHAFVQELGPKDRVWITFFESGYEDFSEQPMTRDALLADPMFLDLELLGTRGGTELLPALEHVMLKLAEHSAGRQTRLVLITDGQVGNEDQVLRRMNSLRARRVPVHCFGIDTAVNDALLKAMASRTGGRCALMTPEEDIPAAVKALAVVLRSPVLTGLTLGNGGDVAVTVTVDDDRLTLPDLHAGEVTLLPVQVAASTAQVTLRGTLPDGSAWTQTFDMEQALGSDEAPRLLWARNRTRHLLASGRAAEAVALSVAHNVVCKGTSFAAWDEAEKVPVAKREVYQPSLEQLKLEKDEAARQAFASGMVAMSPPLNSGPPPVCKSAVRTRRYSMRAQNNFFQGMVTDEQKASRLRECSDDDLVGDLASPPPPPPPAPAPAAQAGSAPDDEHESDGMVFECPPERLERDESAVYKKLYKLWEGPKSDHGYEASGPLELLNKEPRHWVTTPEFWRRSLESTVVDAEKQAGKLIQYRPGYLSVWAEPLRLLLLNEGLGDRVSEAAVCLLCAWAGGDDLNTCRNKDLAAFVKSVESSTTPMEDLQHFVAQYYVNEYMSRFRQLMVRAFEVLYRQGYTL